MGIQRRQYLGWIFVLPAVLFFALFSYYPIINSFVASFYAKDILSLKAPKFIGLQNYIYIFTSQDFLNSIKATAYFACFIPLVSVSLVIATIIVSLRRFPKIQNLFKMIYYSPSIVSGVVSATIWPLIVVQSQKYKTLPLYIVSFLDEKYTNEAALMAVAVLATIPIFTLFFIFSRHFIGEGILTGAKG